MGRVYFGLNSPSDTRINVRYAKSARCIALVVGGSDLGFVVSIRRAENDPDGVIATDFLVVVALDEIERLGYRCLECLGV